MSRRALLSFAAATLLSTACGDIVQIGAEGDVAAPSPPSDGCSTLKCGESCPFTMCTNVDCPPSVGGVCNLDGLCTLDTPVVCAGPSSLCAGVKCGMPCGSCDPNSPNCSTDVDAGPGNPTPVCDAFQQCQTSAVICL